MASRKPRYSVSIPFSERPTEWHPTERTGPFSTLSRGDFSSRREAEVWGKEKLGGQPFRVKSHFSENGRSGPLKDEEAAARRLDKRMQETLAAYQSLARMEDYLTPAERARKKKLGETIRKLRLRQLEAQGRRMGWGEKGFKENGSKLELHAQAYAYDGPGFYFDSLDDYEKKFQAAEKSGFEEFEIQFINGDEIDQKLFEAMQVHQGNLHEYFEAVEEPDETKAAAFILVSEFGYDLSDALRKADDLSLYGGSPSDYVYELLQDIGISEEMASTYFDYESWGRDLILSGEVTYSDYESWADRDAKELAYEVIDSIGRLDDAVGKDAMSRYFDYDALARDMEMNGDIAVVRLDGTDYVITNASEL